MEGMYGGGGSRGGGGQGGGCGIYLCMISIPLCDSHPSVHRHCFEPEQISVSLSSDHDTIWISWITGIHFVYGSLLSLLSFCAYLHACVNMCIFCFVLCFFRFVDLVLCRCTV